ncbi:Clavaminate synthase-like protein [Mycena olivaceomarginata]|nr:Clavaminate synthase-like protein [Mycena olivaceomarginata]
MGEEFPRCVSCTRRIVGDTCRFRNVRSFLHGGDGKLAGFLFQEQKQHTGTAMKYPTEWNVPLEKSHIDKTKKAIAAALLPALRQERIHVDQRAVVYRPRECEVRSTCDTCLTSIFSCSWMCRMCGREACADCFQNIESLTVEPDRRPPASPTHITLLDCPNLKWHGAKDFTPVTRFVKPELVEAIRAMEQLINLPDPRPVMQPGSHSVSSEHASSGDTPDATAFPPSSDSEATLIDPCPVASTDIPAYEIRRFADHELTEAVFCRVWADGDPLLVTDIGRKLKVRWSPEYFITHYGNHTCQITDCETDASKRLSVEQFFKTYGDYDGRTSYWKLKDWPPSKDFRAAFPELYQDFSQAVPIPAYVCRDGALNIASHFPSNTVRPDLGPKMYNANANLAEVGGHGSTRLHMDMADALNIMMYAARDPAGAEGCAAWDIFRAQDSTKLREFLRSNYTIEVPDPIHSQEVYLDDGARRRLWEKYGVQSYRVYQRAGEAIFIPAGCAHQVRNLSDCIKVAIDFVSPENVARCETLTQEFREQNESEAWKEDVLQLRTMMWFAWLSCCEQEKAHHT